MKTETSSSKRNILHENLETPPVAGALAANSEAPALNNERDAAGAPTAAALSSTASPSLQTRNVCI